MTTKQELLNELDSLVDNAVEQTALHERSNEYLYRGLAGVYLWWRKAQKIDGFLQELYEKRGISTTKKFGGEEKFTRVLRLVWRLDWSGQKRANLQQWSLALREVHKEYESNTAAYKKDAQLRLAQFIDSKGGITALINATQFFDDEDSNTEKKKGARKIWRSEDDALKIENKHLELGEQYFASSAPTIVNVILPKAIAVNRKGYAAQQHDRGVWLEKEEWNKLGEVEYKRLLDNPLFIRIYDEFQKINATIIQYYKDKECEIGGFVYSNIDPNWEKKGKETNKRTNPQKLAWIYQACETLIREQFEQLSGQRVLLRTHDCIYFKEKLDEELVRDIKRELEKTFKYINFECEPVSPIADDETRKRRLAERDEADDDAIARQLEMQQRDDFWQRQEGITLEMRPNDMCETLLKPQDAKSEYEYKVTRGEQFMRDVGIKTYDVGSTSDEYIEYEYEYEYVVDQ
jgi:hypothetical protein